MGNPRLDHGADAIGRLREQPHVAALETIEQQLAETALEHAPELDRRLMGAAWMLLGEGLAELATASGDGLPAQLLINLTQLAGQRLYAGTGLPREVRCPELYSTGVRCRFVAKGVVDELIDAQMRGHYGTYHTDNEWAPEHEPLVTVRANYIDSATGERIPAKVTVTRHGDGVGTCVHCTAPVTIHEDGSTTGGVETPVGIACNRCVVLDAAVEAGRPTPESVREGRHSINDLRRAYRLPEIVLPEDVFPEVVDALLREAFAEAQLARTLTADGLPDGTDD